MFLSPCTDLRTPDDLIEAVKPRLGPELVQEFGYIYKFIVTGNNGGTFYLDLKNGKEISFPALFTDYY